MTEEQKDDKKKVQVPEKFAKLVEEIEKMSVLDLSELIKVLEEKFGVSAASMPMMAAVPATTAVVPGEEVEEKSSFNVEIKAVGDKKIEVIKVVRDVTGKGLKEAKDLVDAVATSSQVIAENLKKEDAEEMKKKFETAGAQIALK